MTTPPSTDVGLFDLDDLDDATWWDLYGDLVDSDAASVQCVTCRLVTTVAAIEGRGHHGHAAHGPHSKTCRRYV